MKITRIIATITAIKPINKSEHQMSNDHTNLDRSNKDNQFSPMVMILIPD